MKEPKRSGLREFFKRKIMRVEGFRVSKNYFLDIDNGRLLRKGNPVPYDLDGKILAYEDRQNSWFFDIADFLKNKKEEEGGFVVLMICIAYLEATQQFIEGKSSDRNSSPFIKRSLKRIFPEMSEEDLNTFVKSVRCGLFHDGMLRKGIFIDVSQNSLFLMHQDMLVINPYQFLDWIKRDFIKYVKLLKNPTNNVERDNFEKMWDQQKGL